MSNFDVIIVGGGSGGISVASQIRNKKPGLSVAIIEPSEVHYYQPIWTLVGGGDYKKEDSKALEKDLIPEGVTWIKDFAASFNAEQDNVTVKSGETHSYKNLILAPGIQIDWHKIKGLKEAMGKDGVCSNYSYETVDSTFEAIKNFKSGNAIFTFPSTPIKCGGAPQKIMWLAEHYFEKHNKRKDANVVFASAGGGIFGIKKYAAALQKLVEKRNIDARYHINLIEIKGGEKKAVFENLQTKEISEIEYDMIHVTPPMSSPDFIKESPFANDGGWIDVNKETLQHNKFKNVFALGDASSLPTAKTGAGIRKQAPILVNNLIASIAGKEMTSKYDGYTSCPLVTGYGRLILAEFNYQGEPVESFPFDQGKERKSMYLLKKYLLPILYWKFMLKGRG